MTETNRRRAGLPLLLAGSLLLTLPGLALAEEGETEGAISGVYPQALGSVDWLAPAAEYLAGRSGMIAAGQDPAWAEIRTGGVRDGADPGGLLGSGRSERAQAAGAGLAPYRDPGPAFSTNHLITRDFGQGPYQTEPSIAVNPADPDHIILGTIDYGFPSNSAYVSLDGGESWEGPFRVPYILDDLGSGGDPVVTFDRDGAAYMTGISIGLEEFTVGPVQVYSEVSSMSVARSEDGGFTWPETFSAARSRVSTDGLEPDRFGRLRGNLSIGFYDKPWITVGPDPDDPERDIIYLTYTDFDIRYEVLWLGEVPTIVPVATRSTIELVRSEDGGRTWSEPIAVSPTVQQGNAEPDGDGPGVFGTKRVVQGSQPVVAEDGTLYVTWIDSTDDDSQKGIGEIYVARSEDRGATFEPSVVASTFNELAYRTRNAFFRAWASGFPQIALGPEEQIYIAYAAKPSDRPRDDSDIWIVRSEDGESWSRPARLNDDDTTAPQIYPSIDVSPDGTVHAMWGDMRDDPTELRYHIYYTTSTDGGETWGFEIPEIGGMVGDTRASDFATNPNYAFPGGRFIGDYFSLKATDEDVYMVWPDGRLGEYGPPNQKIAFTRRRAVPAPELFLSPPSGPGGQQVTLQGFGFQPDLTVFVLLGDSTVAQARTDETGQFTNVFYMPITSEGAQTLTVVDESGNRASTSYYTEFGFGNILDQYRELSSQLDELRGRIDGAGDPEASPAP